MATAQHDLIVKTIADLRERSPEALRAVLFSDEWLERGMKCFAKRLDDGERDAMRLYFEAIGAVGSREQAIMAALLASLGVASLEAARDFVRRGQAVAEASSDDAYRLARQICRMKIQADPRERKRLLQELFGLLDVAEVEQVISELPPPATNGHTNGNGAH